MTLVVFGSNHRLTSPSRLQAVSAQRTALLAQLLASREQGRITGGLLLATCNRLEFVLDTPGEIPEGLRKPFADIESRVLQGEEVVPYMLRLACGLESMVVGEDQILGQLRDAFKQAEAHDLLSPPLHGLRNKLMAAARDIRRRTGLQGSKASVASLGARQLSAHVGVASRIAVIGAGETGRLALQTLLRLGHKDLLVVNRSAQRADALGKHLALPSMSLADFQSHTPKLDGLLVAIHAESPVLGARTLRGLKMVVDVSMPGVVDAASIQGPGAPTVLDLDGLATLSANDDGKRTAAARAAAELVIARARVLQREASESSAHPGHIIEQHLDHAMADLDRAFRGKLSHLTDADQAALREIVQRTAKRNAHLHLQDVKQLQRSQ